MRPPPSLWLTTLGCAKNQVDSEKITAVLIDAGYRLAESPETADVVMVNTCAFIEEARAESVSTILEIEERRRPESHSMVIGCMAQRFGAELESALPEVDVVLGLDRYTEIVDTVDRLTQWRPVAPPRRPVMDILHSTGRPATGQSYAYLKVAEGCDKPCSFCAIPSIRGRQRSRRPHEIRHELVGLVSSGVSEVVLVAQDLAAYGRDIGAPGGLPELLEHLCDVAGLRALRLLYLHPREITDRLMDTVTASPVVVDYYDLSLQHVSRELLRAMRRPGDTERHLGLISRIRSRTPDAALRSSFIVGFPGETESDVEDLESFLLEAGLDWAGFFPYSAETGTSAAAMEGQIPREAAMDRLRHLDSVQEEVTVARNRRWLGSRSCVVVDQIDDGVPVARSYRHAPEIDGVVTLDGGRPGQWLDVEYVGVYGPDMEAVVV